jgi:coproporphyrinogen III oxidase
VLERGGVLFSHVRGDHLPPSATGASARSWRGAHGKRSVCRWCSIPAIRTRHGASERRFFTARGGDAPVWWFGGGMDLTPYYGYEEDARDFHAACRDALAPFGAGLYPPWKRACDEYFYLRHRREARGIGGIFFDDFDDGGFDRCFAVVRSVGDAFLAAYAPILARRKDTPYGERERDFQSYRRGRYVEFNLVWDRGTLFGLQSGGRTEAILLSLPPIVKWRYDWRPEPGTREAELTERFLPPRDWLA